MLHLNGCYFHHFHDSSSVPYFTPVWREALGELSVLAQEHHTMTTRSES